MSTRRGSAHSRCARCRIHHTLCFCEHIKPLQIQSSISVIVHVRELRLTSNTPHFLQLMMPQNVRLDVRGQMNDIFQAAPLLERPGRPLFLYPDENSQELSADFLTNNPGPWHLIVPDGSWHQARKVYAREKAFHHIPTVRIPAGAVGEYHLRKAPRPDWVSTYEAVAHALGIMEGESVRNQLMDFFRIFVHRTIRARQDFYNSGFSLKPSLE